MIDLSLGGCRILTDQPFQAGILIRVEVQFQLQGISFRIVGVIVGSRAATSIAVRFLDLPQRRRDELAEVLEEVAQKNAAKPAASADEAQTPPAAAAPASIPAPILDPASVTAHRESANPPVPAPSQDRRSHSRHAVDTSARLLLVTTGISMSGRILNLSLGGCRIRTDERFNVGIYVRIEAEFYLHGLPFRIGGVSQAILDKNTIGVRFLDMSDRRRQQLTELIAEIAAAGSASTGNAAVPEGAGITAASGQAMP
jgi:c-di-GMP-binding flagellar brake protein YcgR